MTTAEIQAFLLARLGEVLAIEAGGIDPRTPFADHGLSSREAVGLSGDLERRLGQPLSPSLLYDFPTPEALARHLGGDPGLGEGWARAAVPSALEAPGSAPIAVVGLACRFPGAADASAFWRLLVDGGDAVGPVPAGRWDAEALYDPSLSRPGTASSKWGGFLAEGPDGVAGFDPHFFGLSPREAARIDPQQRLLLEVAWEALEDAGLPPAGLAGGAVGVFTGISSGDYALLPLASTATVDAWTGSGNAHAMAANRLSYLFDWHGPSLAVDTACSSSLVAVHLACRSLRAGECAVALAAGVNLMLTPHWTIAFSHAGMMAADGRCKTFDAAADGYVRGEGCGVVVLKRLADARRGGDRILAVIAGSAVNQDGRSNGLTAPHGPAQEAVIAGALADAGLPPAAVGYVEAHGTGTPLGDRIEAQALAAAYGTGRPEDEPLLVGSVKTNLGHLEAAAGIAGLIKVVLALRHGVVPPHLHLHEPAEYLNGALAVPTSPTPWPTGRGAGVSSFGFGGTNAHVVVRAEGPSPLAPLPRRERGTLRGLAGSVQEGVASAAKNDASGNERADGNWADAPHVRKAVPLSRRGRGDRGEGPHPDRHLLPLSATTPTALRALAARYAEWLAAHPQADLADVALTAGAGRAHHACRLVLSAATADEARDQLEGFLADREGRLSTGTASPGRRPRVVFLFPGQGCQFAAMGRELYERWPVFRSALEAAAEILGPHLPEPLLAVLYGGRGDLDDTLYTQPALLAFSHALAALWRSWGIVPDAVVGHSVGEYAAACVAGALTLEAALPLVAARARRMAALPTGGRMAAVLAGGEAVARVLGPLAVPVAVAAWNGPGNTVISGDGVAIDAALAALEAAGLEHRPVATSHAFHSPLMEPILDGLEADTAAVAFGAPQIPFYSNLTGRRLETGEALDGAYWRALARSPVRFAEAVEAAAAELSADGSPVVFLEMGPRAGLTEFGHSGPAGEHAVFLPSLAKGREDARVVLAALGELYVRGGEPDWRALAGPGARRISLPSYPFERQRCWLDLPPGGAPVTTDPTPRETTLAALQRLFSRLLETTPERLPADLPLLRLGADSIVLLSALRGIEGEFGVKLAVRQVFEELSTLGSLAEHIERVRPVIAEPEPVAELMPEEPAPGGSVEQLLGRQLEILREVMLRQIEALTPGQVHENRPTTELASRRGGPGGSAGRATRPSTVEASHPGRVAHPPQPPDPPLHEAPKTPPSAFSPYQPERAAAPPDLTPLQARHVAELAAAHTARTGRSKEYARASRRVHADFRSSMHFRQATKEMLYPIVACRSAGSRIWDLDGHEYVDLTMGFGVNLFGHAPEFVTAAIREQMERGMHLGPQSDLAAEVAERISRLTGLPRVAFANTGTEAVMAAVRLARAATGRRRIALFAGSYHGTFDGVLAGPALADGEPRALPTSLGVPPGMVEDVVVLTYRSAAALDYVKTHGGELAAVLVEPVQSRHPDGQPQEFLRELRRLTRERGTALVFDEVITGFRIHPGGAQAWFGVRADLAAYGKVVGGGLPIGVVAGEARFLDAIDGGEWSYGDASYPRLPTALYAGTFCKHPLALAAARAVLQHIEREGIGLYQRLNRQTAEMVEALNGLFERAGVAVHTERFGSLFRFRFPFERAFSEETDLFFLHLLHRGLYVWEGRNGFLSTAHTGEDTARVVDAVAATLAGMRQGGFFATAGAAAPEAPAVRELPLAAAQAQLWVLAQRGGAGFEPVVLAAEGLLDLARLRRAWGRVIERHEGLRTTVSRFGDRQLVHLPAALSTEVPLINFGHLDAAERERQVTEWLRGEGSRPFDLEHGPLVRLRVLRLGESSCRLVVTAHHLAVDGWSTAVLIQELAAFYSAEESGVAAALPAASQLGDYVAWLDGRRAGGMWEADERYWLERLGRPLPPLALPTDRPRPATPSLRGARVTLTVGAAVAEGLARLAERAGATPFMLLAAAFTALLHRITRQEEIHLGFPVAGRSMPGAETLVAYCSHLVALPSRLEDGEDPRFAAHLAATRAELLAAYEHAEVPFAHLLPRLALAREPGAPPLFGATFNLEPPLPLPRFAGLELALAAAEIGTTGGELHVNVTQLPAGLQIHADYATDLFDEATARRLLGWYETLLTGLSRQGAEATVHALPLLSKAEREEILAVATVALPGPSVLARFAHWVAATPTALAVTCGPAEISYAELDARAGHLAAGLRRLGAGPEVPVAIALEPSVELVVAILGIWKAGAAYLPLDPGHPPGRLAALLADAGATLAVVSAATANLLPADVAPVFLPSSGAALDSPVLPENLAYVIYTSGSTGLPKGVAVEHRQLASYVAALLERLAPPPGSSFGMISTAAADLGHTMLFAALAIGGRLDLLTAHAAEPGALAAALRRRPVDYLKIVPGHLAALLAGGEAAILPRHAVVLGGESLGGELCRLIAGLAPGLEIWNHYGPTETTVGVIAGRVADRGGEGSLPLGFPLAGRRILLLGPLGPAGEPVPAGVPGELYVGEGGAAVLARGYLGRPDLTAERFLPDPFAGEPGGRLYRTGDMARWLRGGTIEFLGRADGQVKIRGFRVEPGEVAAALAVHPAVRQAVVVARAEGEGRRQLVGYVVPADAAVTPAELRGYLAERLPEPMVPAAVVVLAALPLGSNGKLDRSLLPLASIGSSSAGSLPRGGRSEVAPAGSGDLEGGLARLLVPREAENRPPALEVADDGLPRTPEERLLAGIWADLLGVPSVGRGDNFLELGGDSILGIQMIARALEAGLELTVEDFFGYRTLAEFAAATRLPAAETIDSYPLSPMQRAMLLHSLASPGTGEYVELKIADLAAPLDVGAFTRAWQAVVDAAPILRTRFAWEGLAEPRQLVAGCVALVVGEEDWRGLGPAEQGRRQEELLAAERRRGFDLALAPLQRLALVRLSDSHWRLFWSYHHLLLDGWSATLVVREARRLYEALRQGQPATPGKLTPFRAYVDWLARQDEAAARAFWRQELAELKPAAALGGDEAGTAALAYGQRRLPLPAALIVELKALARRHQLTLNTLVQGAWALRLALAGEPNGEGTTDAVFGSVGSGRHIDLPGIDTVVGLTINTVPVRVRVPAAGPLLPWLADHQTRQFKARRFEHLPLATVEAESPLPPGRRLFDSLLVFINHPAIGDDWATENVSSQQTGFPLHLVVEPDLPAVTLTWRESHLDAATALRLGGHLENLLTGLAAAGPETPIAALSPLSPSERRQLLTEWNDTELPFPLETPFFQLFEQTAKTFPEATAVSHGHERATYRELAQTAHRLASHLRQQGLGPDDLVALCAERSIPFLAAILALFEAGAAYLPLDPNHPEARREQMRRHSKARLILTNADLKGLAGRNNGARPGGESSEDGAQLSERQRVHEHRPEPTSPPGPPTTTDLAYVIYTSGSTGAPKGAMVENRGMVNHLYAKIEALSLTATDVVAQTASQCFDVSVWQLLAPLLVGGRVDIFADEEAHDPRALWQRVLAQKVTILELVPSMLAALLDELERSATPVGSPALRWLLATGETLPPALCRRWLALFPAIPILNAYGPTECSDDVAHFALHAPPAEGEVRIPIGRPIANTRLYVVDRGLRLLPAGVAGELAVGGAGVGRGYLHDPERTAEAFCDDPFAGTAGARLYRTGDRARLRPDGRIEFLGRLDDQVKVRGVRIEPGEIEAVLARHSAVRQAAVAVRPGRDGDPRLVAWVVLHAGSHRDGKATADDLAYHLGKTLPEPMVPGAFVFLESLPLSDNGKVDRRALPEPAEPGETVDPAPASLAPRTPVEGQLAQIWARALRLPRVGVQDNFFKLGGHSLLATQVILRVRDELGLDLPIHSLFEMPTIAGLAERVETLRQAAAWGRRNGSGAAHATREEGEL